MSLLNKYKKLEDEADKHLGKHDNMCQKMLDIVLELLDVEDTSDFNVFKQTDGYVINDLEGRNIPVKNIIEWHEKTGELVNEDILQTFSI